MSDGGIGLQYSISAGVDDGENDEDGEDSDYKFHLNPSASIRLNGGSHGLSGIDQVLLKATLTALTKDFLLAIARHIF